MKYFAFIGLFFLPLVYSCNKMSCKKAAKPDCACIEIYDPVCGCNKKTYSNSCHAECDGVEEYSKGECKLSK